MDKSSNIKDKYKSELLNSIPVIAAMNVDITDIGDSTIELTAPLDTNINYEGTAFGGSLNTLCILSGYLLVHHILKSQSIHFSSLVIQDSQVRYLKPVTGNFHARATISDEHLESFQKMMRLKGKGRAQISSTISTSLGSELVTFEARFVVS